MVQRHQQIRILYLGRRSEAFTPLGQELIASWKRMFGCCVSVFLSCGIDSQSQKCWFWVLLPICAMTWSATRFFTVRGEYGLLGTWGWHSATDWMQQLPTPPSHAEEDAQKNRRTSLVVSTAGALVDSGSWADYRASDGGNDAATPMHLEEDVEFQIHNISPILRLDRFSLLLDGCCWWWWWCVSREMVVFVSLSFFVKNFVTIICGDMRLAVTCFYIK